MAHEIKLLDSAAEELRALRVFDQRRITDEMKRNLRHEPTVASRNRKCLLDFMPTFEHVPPIWELRVGEFRIFYDVDADAQIVYVRAVRRKAQDQATEDIA